MFTIRVQGQTHFTHYASLVFNSKLQHDFTICPQLTMRGNNSGPGWCNVHYRLFDFTKYGAHVRKLNCYAFKFLIIKVVILPTECTKLSLDFNRWQFRRTKSPVHASTVTVSKGVARGFQVARPPPQKKNI